VINIKKNTNYGYFNVSQQVFLRYRIANDFVYVVMKRHLCVESRLSALSAAILTFNGLIDRFSLWLPGCMFLPVTVYNKINIQSILICLIFPKSLHLFFLRCIMNFTFVFHNLSLLAWSANPVNPVFEAQSDQDQRL
jgi:hypothetical protein